MAVLSKIRQRSFFLIIIIALALFSFVLADVIQSGTFSSDANNVGSVNGTDIDAQEFMQNVAMIEKQGQGTTSTQALNSAWEQEVRRIILSEEFDKLGLKIGGEQLINIIKQNPNLAQNPEFLNAAGLFDENKLKEFLKGIKNAPHSPLCSCLRPRTPRNGRRSWRGICGDLSCDHRPSTKTRSNQSPSLRDTSPKCVRRLRGDQGVKNPAA